VQIDEIPQIGNQLAVGDQPEVEPVEIAVHRDVEPMSSAIVDTGM
jgi:hypothetical protein